MRVRPLLLSIVFLLLAVLLLTVLLPQHLGRGGGSEPGCRAAIVDGLYSSYPNNTLLDMVSRVLESHGCSVDVFLGSKAGLDVFSHLTRYNVVVLRVHGGYMVSRNRTVGGLFTGVPWSTRYLELARRGLAAEGIPVTPPERGPKVYLALLPRFFEERMHGRFPPGAVIIAGGCYTALDRELVKALCKRGLAVYVGFNGEVTVSELDRLLGQLVREVLQDIGGGYERLRRLEGLHPNITVVVCGGKG